MERYCIQDENWEKVLELWQSIKRKQIRMDGFMKYDIFKVSPEIFPECQEDFVGLGTLETDSECYSEEETYQDIIENAGASELLFADLCFHMYYTTLYKLNAQGEYIPLVDAKWDSTVKDDIRKKRKEFRQYLKNHELELPFDIKDGAEKKVNKDNKIYYDEIKMLNFAPNLVRLFYFSKEFRNVFSDVKKFVVDKYKFSNMINMFESQREMLQISCIEEIWLCERMLGVNLALEFYSFFSKVLINIDLTTIEKEYSEVMRSIISKIMKWSGIYGRSVFIRNMKVVYEIIANKNDKWSKKELLQYLDEKVLNVIEEIVVKSSEIDTEAQDERIYSKEEVDYLGEKCQKLLEEYFELDKRGYYFLKENKTLVALADTGNAEVIVYAADGQETKSEIKFNENLYAIIQKMIICM